MVQTADKAIFGEEEKKGGGGGTEEVHEQRKWLRCSLIVFGQEKIHTKS